MSNGSAEPAPDGAPRSPELPGEGPVAGRLPGPHRHPCSAACTLPHQRVGRPVRALRALSVAGLLTAGLVATVFIDPRRPWTRDFVRRWSRSLLRSLGIRHEVHTPEGRREKPLYGFPLGALLASNHTSWLDVFALFAVGPVRLVSKGDVAAWPLLGRLASWTGTVFLRQAEPAALRETVDETARLLRGGDCVGFFPEGATWCGRAGGTYRPAMFQAALDSGAPVVPVVLRYRAPGNEPATAQAYTRIPLGRSIRTVLGLRGLVVEVHVLAPVSATSATGRAELARQVQAHADAVRFRPFEQSQTPAPSAPREIP